MKYLILVLCLSGCASTQVVYSDNEARGLKVGYAAGICALLGDMLGFQKTHRSESTEKFLRDYFVVFLNREDITKKQLIKDCKAVREYRNDKLNITKVKKRREWEA